MSIRINNQYNHYYNNNFDSSQLELPLISMKQNKNFTLVNNKKGKIINKPLFSGYTKSKLSSIPRPVEIILINKDKENLINNQSTLFSKFSGKNDLSTKTITKSINTPKKQVSKAIYTNDSSNINNKTIIPHNYSENKTTIHKSKVGKKSQNFWNFYITKKNIQRNRSYFSQQEYMSILSPGPSDYNPAISFDKVNSQNKFRYKGLFRNRNARLKNTVSDFPGPGSYINMDKLIADNENKHININLGRKEKRFKFNSIISPWLYSYNTNKKIETNLKTPEDKDINHLNNNKDCYDYKHFILKEIRSDTGKKQKIYVEDKTYSSMEKTKRSIDTKEKKNEFKTNKMINNILKKYVDTGEKKEYQVPGPGMYNICTGFDKIYQDNKANESLRNKDINKNLIPEQILKQFALNKNDPSIYYHVDKMMLISKSSEDILGKDAYEI